MNTLVSSIDVSASGSMSHPVSDKDKTGITQPVVHQASIVVNTRAPMGFIRKRKAMAVDMEAANPANKRLLTNHLKNCRASDTEIYCLRMHELAFREAPGNVFGGRSQSVHLSSMEVFTAFNERKLDDANPPSFIGVVDNGEKPTLNGPDTASKGVVVAMQGTRSTFNTGPNTIHMGDRVYWDYPKVKTIRGGITEADRPRIEHTPQDKLIAITISLPQGWVSAFSLTDMFSVNFADDADIDRYLFKHGVPVFLQNILRDTLLVVKRNQPESILYPYLPPALHKSNNQMAIIAAITDRVHALLKSHEVGTAHNTALSGKQLDIMIRG